MSRTYVETSTVLLEGIDEMVKEGFYHDRTEAVNDALRILLKQYKLSKLHAKDQQWRTSSSPVGGDPEQVDPAEAEE